MNRISPILLIIILLASITATYAQKASKAVVLSPAQQEQVELSEKLIQSTEEYRLSLEKLVKLYEIELNKTKENITKKHQLYEQGIISKRELETSEQAIETAQNRLTELTKQIEETDTLMVEAKAMAELARNPIIPKTTNTRINPGISRYEGGDWVLAADAPKVEQFFQAHFGRALPISAYGQSETHNRLGFNHTNAMDVALPPDGVEGQALIAFLRSSNIPFLAFTHAIPGVATGAHIHIGRPSSRLVAAPVN